MRAAYINGYGGAETVEVGELPLAPEPGSGQVRLRVAGAAVTPTDLKVRSGELTDYVPATFPWILGWDVSGIVEAVGPGPSEWGVGDRVLALWDQHFVAAGSHAEFVTLDGGLLAPAPRKVDLVTAAALPIAGVTAAQALELLALTEGQRLLVAGGSGVVGTLAIELAQLRGLRVAATAHSAAGAEIVRSFGVDSVFDDSELQARSFDGVLHLAGPVSVIDTIRDDGRFVSVVSGAVISPQRGIDPVVHYFVAQPQLLQTISEYVDAGLVTPRVASVVPLADARKAHESLRTASRGRVILKPHP